MKFGVTFWFYLKRTNLYGIVSGIVIWYVNSELNKILYLEALQVQNQHSRRVVNQQLFHSVSIHSLLFWTAVPFSAQLAAHFVVASHKFTSRKLVQTRLHGTFAFLAKITGRHCTAPKIIWFVRFLHLQTKNFYFKVEA